MLATTFSLFLAAFGSIVSAQILARFVPQDITERASRPAGGLALVPNGFCSNDLLSCANGDFCCPTSLTCAGWVGISGSCCPEGLSCGTALSTAPYCADDTWTLWDESQGGIALEDYFCCAPGLVGLLTGKCVDPATLSSPTLEAMLMAPGGAPLTTSATTLITTTAIAVSVPGTTVAKTITSTSSSNFTATTGVVVVASGGSTVSTKSVSSAGGSTAGVTASSSSAQPSTTKASSGGSLFRAFELGSVGLGALALFAGVAL